MMEKAQRFICLKEQNVIHLPNYVWFMPSMKGCRDRNKQRRKS